MSRAIDIVLSVAYVMGLWAIAGCIGFAVGYGAQAVINTEESFYYFAPIAVAVLAYLLDHRQARRYELEGEAIKERVRAVELAHVSGFARVETSEAIQDKTLEYHDGRLSALEGTEGGLPKEAGDKIQSRLDELSTNIGNIAFAHNVLSSEVKAMKSEEDE